ncbi:MAG TPA: SIMPL domain-containing protein [Rhizomicrobium sp.]|jgi:hypothetical protein
MLMGHFRDHIKIGLEGIVLALCLTTSAPSASAAEPTPVERTITVSGTGEARAAPDQAHLSAGVVTQARKAADALAANTRAMNGVFAALRHLGIPDKSMQTSGFSVAPQYRTDRNGNSSSAIDSYQVSNTVNVTVDDLGKLGPALDALVASGSNSIGSIAFTIRDPKPMLAQARAEAMKDAIARAQTFAKAGGFALGPIVSVGEGGVEMPQPVFNTMRMAAAPMAPPPIAAGENILNASVTVTFAIR